MPENTGVTRKTTGWGEGIGGDFCLDPEGMFSGFVQQAGTLENWMELSPIIAAYPRVRTAIYASLLPPLMRVLGGVENFSFQITGPPATGKTTCIALGASLWGNPGLGTDKPVLMPWSASQDFLLEAAATFRDMPMFLEDYEGSNPRGRVDKLASVLSGRGGGEMVRGRLTPIRTWSTVVLSSAVRGVEDLDETQSLASRSITLWGAPFGKADPETAEAVSEIQRIMRRNYGHIGPEWIRRVEAAREAWPKWGANHDKRVARFSAKAAEQGGFAARSSRSIAALATTAVIFHSLFQNLEWDHNRTIEDLWVWLNLNGHKTSKGWAGMEVLRAWWADQKTRMFGQGGACPKGGWQGVIRTNRQGVRIAWILEHVVRDILVEAGFNHTEVYEDWVRGDICIGTWGRVWRTQPIGTGVKRCIGFPLEVLEEKPEFPVET